MPAKYRIIARELEHQLRRSSAVQKLPTEAALCEQYACSRQTIRSALKLLEEKGLIVRRQGSGSYPARSAFGSRRIAVILADKEEYTSPALLRDIRKAAAEAGCTVVCYETHGSVAAERDHLETLLSRRPAGILLQPICDVLGSFSEDLLARIHAEQIPLIDIEGRYPGGTAVRYDEGDAATRLSAHLAACGHRRIAALLKADDSRGIARWQGLVRAAPDAGISLLPENCLWYTEQERLKLLDGDNHLLRRFLAEYRGSCSAVVCFNDEIGFRLLRFLRHEHQETAVLSYDNSYLARSAALTSFGPAGETVGTAAVRALLQAIEGKEASNLFLPQKLIVRKSG